MKNTHRDKKRTKQGCDLFHLRDAKGRGIQYCGWASPNLGNGQQLKIAAQRRSVRERWGGASETVTVENRMERAREGLLLLRERETERGKEQE